MGVDINYGTNGNSINNQLTMKLREKSHPLGHIDCLPPNNENEGNFNQFAARDRFENLVEIWKNCTGMNFLPSPEEIQQYLGTAVAHVQRIETEYHQQLIELAISLVKEEFGITNEIMYRGTIRNIGNIRMPNSFYEGKNDTRDMCNGNGDCVTNLEEKQMNGEPIAMQINENVAKEIRKRVFCNALIQGASVKGHFLFNMNRERINEINPQLSQFYNILMGANDLTYFFYDDGLATEAGYAQPQQMDQNRREQLREQINYQITRMRQQGQNQMADLLEEQGNMMLNNQNPNVNQGNANVNQGNANVNQGNANVNQEAEVGRGVMGYTTGNPAVAGFNQLKFENGNPIVVAEGVNFPVLLHEFIKGTMELLATNALPNDDVLENIVLTQADNLLVELWGIRLGGIYWERINRAIPDNHMHNKGAILGHLFRLPTDEFNEIMMNVLSENNEGGRIMIENIANQVGEAINNLDIYEDARTNNIPENNLDDLNLDHLF